MAEFKLKVQKLSENQHQKLLFQWASCYWWHKFMLHISNEELLFSNVKNPWPLINHRKAMGVRRGFPDVAILFPMFPYHGFFIELKAAGKKPTEHQEEWLERLTNQGYVCYWSDNFENSIKYITDYLGENLTGKINDKNQEKAQKVI